MRKTGSAQSSFLLLGRNLKKLSLIQCSAEAFAQIREDAERRAFDKVNGLNSNISLERIYQEVGYTLRLTSQQVEKLQRIEEKLEFELLSPAPQALKIISESREKGRKIFFISDMYMETSFIRDRLLSFEIMKEGDRLFVSKDYGKSKHAGSLYSEIIRQERIAKTDLIHCGNDPWPDVKSARKAGLQVNHFLAGNLNRYEQVMEEFACMSEGLSAVMAGASRLTRLSSIGASEQAEALEKVAVGVAAPWLVGFTLWVFERAQSIGIKRLYFLSRDGQILVDIADRLMKKLGLDFELVYLYGSRQAWLLSSLTTLDEEKLSWIFNLEIDVDHLSPKILFSRFSILPEKIEESLKKIGIYPQDWNKSLSRSEREKLFRHILSDPDIQRLILLKSSEKRDILLRYLEQVGLLKDDNFGVIDLGTGATLHNALAAVLETQNLKPPQSFYMGLRNIPDSKYGHPEPYMYDGRHDLGFTNSPGLITLIETVCSADHGSVIDYEISENIVHPVFNGESNQAVMDWGYPIVRNAILTFTDYLLLDGSLLNPWADVRAMSAVLQQTFWLNPSTQEAQAWGSFPMEDGWGKESESLVLATPYAITDLPRLCWHLFRDGEIKYWRRHWWHHGAISMSQPWIQLTFAMANSAIAILRKVRWKFSS